MGGPFRISQHLVALPWPSLFCSSMSSVSASVVMWLSPLCVSVSPLLFKFDFSLFIFGGTGSLLLQRLFSSCGMQGLLSSCGAWASHCGGFSCYRALGPSDSAVVV